MAGGLQTGEGRTGICRLRGVVCRQFCRQASPANMMISVIIITSMIIIDSIGDVISIMHRCLPFNGGTVRAHYRHFSAPLSFCIHSAFVEWRTEAYRTAPLPQSTCFATGFPPSTSRATWSTIYRVFPALFAYQMGLPCSRAVHFPAANSPVN